MSSVPGKGFSVARNNKAVLIKQKVRPSASKTGGGGGGGGGEARPFEQQVIFISLSEKEKPADVDRCNHFVLIAKKNDDTTQSPTQNRPPLTETKKSEGKKEHGREREKKNED